MGAFAPPPARASFGIGGGCLHRLFAWMAAAATFSSCLKSRETLQTACMQPLPIMRRLAPLGILVVLSKGRTTSTLRPQGEARPMATLRPPETSQRDAAAKPSWHPLAASMSLTHSPGTGTLG